MRDVQAFNIKNMRKSGRREDKTTTGNHDSKLDHVW